MLSTARARRSALYMPASNVRAMEKAKALSCDVVILDLEDSVAPDAKDVARANVIAAVKAGGYGRQEVVIRINGFDTPWGADDIAAVNGAKVDAVLVPKISSRQDIERYRALLGSDFTIWAMIETCDATLRLLELAEASADFGVGCWVAGTNDLAKEMRCGLTVDRAPLMSALAMMITAARSRSIAVLDGVYNDLNDDCGLHAQCSTGAAFGFDGKTLIHPRQIDICNAAFSPSQQEIAWSRKIVEIFALPENRSNGVLRIDGRMVERLHLAQAKAVLALADLITG